MALVRRGVVMSTTLAELQRDLGEDPDDNGGRGPWLGRA